MSSSVTDIHFIHSRYKIGKSLELWQAITIRLSHNSSALQKEKFGWNFYLKLIGLSDNTKICGIAVKLVCSCTCTRRHG